MISSERKKHLIKLLKSLRDAGKLGENGKWEDDDIKTCSLQWLQLFALRLKPELIYAYASEALRADQDFILKVFLKAVQRDGLALEYASEDVKNNVAVVSAAVKQKGLALEYVSEELVGNPDSEGYQPR